MDFPSRKEKEKAERGKEIQVQLGVDYSQYRKFHQLARVPGGWEDGGHHSSDWNRKISDAFPGDSWANGCHTHLPVHHLVGSFALFGDPSYQAVAFKASSATVEVAC